MIDFLKLFHVRAPHIVPAEDSPFFAFFFTYFIFFTLLIPILGGMAMESANNAAAKHSKLLTHTAREHSGPACHSCVFSFTIHFDVIYITDFDLLYN